LALGSAALPWVRAVPAPAPAAADPADQLRRELAQSQQDLIQARQDADQLRNQLQSAQDDLVVRTRALETKLAQAQQAQTAAAAKVTARKEAPAVADHRLADLEAALADTQKMTMADQATIAGLKDDLGAAQAELAAKRSAPAPMASPPAPAVAKLQAEQHELLLTNAKLMAEIKHLIASQAGTAPQALKDPRVDLRQKDLQTALIAAQEKAEGDHKTIEDLQAQLTTARAEDAHSPAQQQRDALLTEVQTALAAAQASSRSDRDALSRAQADLDAARGELAQNQSSAADLSRMKADLAAETAAATTAAGQRDQAARDLADARAEADRTAAALRAQLQADETKIAAYTPGPDVAQQLADASGRVDLFKRRSAELSAQVDQLTADNRALAAQVAAAKPPSVALAAAPAAPPPARWHVVAEGDSLTRISTRYYGTPSRWQEIYDANRDVLAGESAPVVGQRLRIP